MASVRASAAVGLSIILAVALAGCGPGQPSSAPTATPASTAGPSPTAAPSPPSSAYDLEVVPAMSVGRTIPGARVVFLVTVSGAASDGAVEIAAQAQDATVTVEPKQLQPGVVGEVTVVPAAPAGDEVPLDVVITATRGAVERTETRTLTLVAGTDDWAAEAATHLAPFITWLEANRPELGITSTTAWQGTPGSWVLIVSHYLYFSTDWELDLEWHVMVPPDDWSRICLRRRGSEVAPSLAFEISSVAGKTEPKEIDPPDAVWR